MRLTPRQLNRATLARQLLLRREHLDPVSAVSRLGALQAQEPASPYLALWTRLADLDAAALGAALQDRRLVKATLHRSTLHLISAADYQAAVTAITVVLRTKWMNEARGLPVVRTLPELAEESLAYAAEPRTNMEMRDHAGTLGEPVPGDDLWRRIRRYGHFVQVPGREPWSFGRRPSHVAARAWIEGSPADELASLEHVVRSHLVAFGPSRLADVSQWSGLAVGRLKVGLDRIREVRTFRDEGGHELFDLPGTPLPDADTPAPPRFLPMWDEILLAYKDRGRVLPERHRRRVIAPNGDVLPTYMVNGLVAGLWWAEGGHDEPTRIVLEPFEPFDARTRQALEKESERLAEFLVSREPRVYRRYRRPERRS